MTIAFGRPRFCGYFCSLFRPRRTTDSMRVSEALDLGSIPNAATLNPVSSLEMGFLFSRVRVGVRYFNFLLGSALRVPDPRQCKQLSRVSTNGNATLCSAVCHSILCPAFY